MNRYLRIIILVIIVFSLSKTVLYSQKSTFPPESFLGFRGGWVSSTIFLEIPLEGYASRITGYSAGVAFRSFLQKSVGLQIELNYINIV